MRRLKWFGVRAAFGLALVVLAILWSPTFAGRLGRPIGARTGIAVIALHALSNLFMALEVAILMKGMGVHATGGGALLFKAMDMVSALGVSLGLAWI